jgi:hypothetical protein
LEIVNRLLTLVAVLSTGNQAMIDALFSESGAQKLNKLSRDRTNCNRVITKIAILYIIHKSIDFTGWV